MPDGALYAAGALALASLATFCVGAWAWLRPRERPPEPPAPRADPPPADDIPILVGPPTRQHSPFGRGERTRRVDPSEYPPKGQDL